MGAGEAFGVGGVGGGVEEVGGSSSGSNDGGTVSDSE